MQLSGVSSFTGADQISRGTIYNHFPLEADLLVAVAADSYSKWLASTLSLAAYYQDPLHCFLVHHCQRLKDLLEHKRFAVVRVMPNEALLVQASAKFQVDFNSHYQKYMAWNRQLICQIGELDGYDRTQLLTDFIRGSLINSDDAELDYRNLAVYRQFCYALLQLLGQSDRQVPSDTELAQWLAIEPHTSAD